MTNTGHRKLLLATLLGLGLLIADELPAEFDSYQLVLLKRPASAPELPDERLEEIQARHLEHLDQLYKAGQLAVAGPFGDQPDPSLRGMALYRVGSVEEAKRLAEADPAVQAGRLEVEVLSWYTLPGALEFPRLGQQSEPAAGDSEPTPEAPPGDSGKSPLQVQILAYPGVEFLDLAGPAEVFEVAGHLTKARGLRPIEVSYVGTSAEPVTASHGPTLHPDRRLDSSRLPDILVVPGGPTRHIEENPEVRALIRATVERGAAVLSVCNAALMLADFGLLQDREATTHSGLVQSLARRPGVKAVRGVRFVDSGEIVTAGGVSAGIDGALHLVERLYGRELAAATAEYMEWTWDPAAAVAGRERVTAQPPDPQDRASRLYRGAAGQVLDGDLEVALQWLRGSFEAGYPSPRDALTDPAFEILRAAPELGRRLEELVAEFDSEIPVR